MLQLLLNFNIDFIIEKEGINTITATPVILVSHITISPLAGRGTNLQLRVSAPATGNKLPIIIFAHGFGSSSDAYAPLVDFWVANGFVVIQPTFPDSKTLSSNPNATHSEALQAYLSNPLKNSIWQYRVEDVKHILDQLDSIEDASELKGRTDRTRITAAGHSFGAQTVAMLLGARVISPDGSLGEDLSDSRVKAGVLLAPAGKGGADLSAFAAEHFAFINPGYAQMTTPCLVVVGDKDVSQLTIRGWDWFTDAYTLSPGANALVTLFGGEHMLGGISGYLAEETTDENPERVAVLRELTLAYLRSALYPEDMAWATATAALAENPNALGKIENK